MKTPKITKEKIKEQILDLFILLAASAIGAYSTVSIMIPYGLTSGGLTGIVRIIQSQIDFSFSLMFYIGAAIILILVAIFLGFREVRKILLLTIMFPAALMFFEYLQLPFLPVHDMFLAVIFCGVFNGICTGMIFWRGYSFAGTDALSKILRKKLFPHISQSKILMAIDAVIIIASAFFFGINIALYALVTQVILSKTIDFVLYGFESKIVQMEIITQKTDELVDFIMNDIGRGLSIHKVEGGFTRQTRDQLRLLCSPRESISVKRGIAKIDPEAFVTLMQVDSVWGFGKGFGDIKKD
jgi:uncharacterized membrane-anchored protein YitT (DUF2179 family)